MLMDAQTNASVTVTATYDEQGSNLGNATATAIVNEGGGGKPPVGSDSDNDLLVDTLLAILFGSDENPAATFGNGIIGYSWLPVLGGGMALTIVVAAWFIMSRLGQSQDTDSTVPAETTDVSPTDPSQSATSPNTTSPAFEERVGTYLDTGDYDGAAMAAYAEIYDELAAENGIDAGVTHWDLLQRSQEYGVPEERISDLETVVEAFETAAFAPTSVEPSRAEAAVERARKIKSNGNR